VKVWIFKGEVISPGEVLEEGVASLPQEERYEEELEDYVDAQES